MFKPSPVLGARLRLTTKQVNGGYYKGTRTGSMGAHTPYGRYVIDYRKVRHFVVPDLSACELTPFVTRQVEEKKPRDTSDQAKAEKQAIESYITKRRAARLSPVSPELIDYMKKWEATHSGDTNGEYETMRRHQANALQETSAARQKMMESKIHTTRP